jgi:hypothetical protein
MKKQLKPPLTAAVCVLATALLLANVAQLGGVVVCIGFNGHVGIESLLEGCCISAMPRGASEDAEVAAISSTCGDCTDVKVTALALKSDETLWCQPNLDEGHIGCPACLGEDGHTENATDMDQHSRSLSPLSTVILLT